MLIATIAKAAQFTFMKPTSKSIIPSVVTLSPGGDFETVYEFLVNRFPRIPESIWRERIEHNKVHFDDDEPIRLTTPYQAHRRVCYYREVPSEPSIPFEEDVIFENDEILIADKPHFLPVHPAGKYVNETLITRLRATYGYEELSAAHRIDRLTAGLVLCVKKHSKRGLYQQMFMDGAVEKIYFAVGRIPENNQTHWHIKTRMEPVADHFLMRTVSEGLPNSESLIDLIDHRGEVGLFRLQPTTGKKHQLRVHLCSIGSGILNDPFYPTCLKEAPDNYDQPMQLLAQQLRFTDPATGEKLKFQSKRSLRLFP